MITEGMPKKETVLGVIDNVQFPPQENKPIYSLVVTSERFIATLLSAESESLMKIAAIDGVSTSPSWEFGLKNSIKKIREESHKLMDMDPLSILSVHKGSFAVPYSQVRRIKIRRGGVFSKPYLKLFSYERDYLFRLLANFGKTLDKNTFISYLDILESTGMKEIY